MPTDEERASRWLAPIGPYEFPIVGMAQIEKENRAMSTAKICRKWGTNEGRWLSWNEEHELENELDVIGEDPAYFPLARGRAYEIREKIVDFGWSTSDHDEDPGNEDLKHLLILPKEDWAWIDANASLANWPKEPCAPDGYQGADVDAGLDDSEPEEEVNSLGDLPGVPNYEDVYGETCFDCDSPNGKCICNDIFPFGAEKEEERQRIARQNAEDGIPYYVPGETPAEHDARHAAARAAKESN